MKTVAIFGASGKVGRHALTVLARRDFAVRALVHRTPVAGANITSVAGSLTEAQAVDETVRGADIVVQLATTKEDADTFFDVSLRGTFNILEACRRQGVKQFILFGGDAALGIWFYPQPIPIDENHPFTAYPGYYAFSKVMEETMAAQYAVQYGVPVTVLRSSWVFERDDFLNHFSLLRNVNPAEPGHGFGEVSDELLALVRVKQERIPILMDARGTPLRRHIVHANDVMQAFDRMLDNPSALGQTFNIAGPSPFDYRVAAEYLSQKLGVPMVEIPSPRYHPFEINITRAREDSVAAMVKRAVELYGRIDGAHCNAGVWGKGKITEFDDASWEKVMGVNVKSVFWTAKHVIPVMEAQGGGVFLITTSVAAFIGFPAHALYCASKGALESLVRCLAVDHAGKVRVAGICPGTIDTPMLAATCEGWDKPVAELYAEVARRIPVRRLGQPGDIAQMAAFLLSDEAGYINGTSIVLDGGTMALPPW